MKSCNFSYKNFTFDEYCILSLTKAISFTLLLQISTVTYILVFQSFTDSHFQFPRHAACTNFKLKQVLNKILSLFQFF